MALIIPLRPLPSQIVTVSLANQTSKIVLSQKQAISSTSTPGTPMFLDLYVNDELIIGGVVCENLNRIVRNAYLGFVGDLCFIDNQGDTSPFYTGLGTRYQLVYLELADFAGVDA